MESCLEFKFTIFPLDACLLSRFSHVRLATTLWTVAHQVSLLMRFSRQEYWSGLPCSPLGDLPDPGTEPMPLKSSALVGGFFTTSIPEKPTHSLL